MIDSWISLLLGWPAVTVSLACCAIGLALGSPRWCLFGAVAAMPFYAYLTMNPGKWRIIAPATQLLYLVGVYAVYRRRSGIAIVSLMPFAAVAGWLAMYSGRH